MVNKIVFMLIVITGLLTAQRGEPDAFIMIPGSSGQLFWSPEEPAEGAVITITFEITSSVDVSDLKVSFAALNQNTQFIGQKNYAGSINKGETKRFITTVKFYRPVGRLLACAYISSSGYCLAVSRLTLLYDTLTNTFVSSKEYWSRRAKPKPPLPPEYTYDIITGMHTTDILPEAEARKVRLQIDSLKQLDSTLTDEESLEMLHDIEVQMLVRYGISDKEKSVPILIKARKLMKEQGLSKWKAVDKVVEQEKEKGRINFFRLDGSGNTDYGVGSDSISKQKTDVTLTGTVAYKKHLIDKDIGLDTTTMDMPLRFAKVYFWCYWTGQGGHFVGPALTNNNGQFTYTD